MTPIDFFGKTHDLRKPKNWDNEKRGKCNALPVKVERDNYVSVWKPSDEERAAIARGENIVLSCFTLQPPVLLTVAPIDGPDAWAPEPKPELTIVLSDVQEQVLRTIAAANDAGVAPNLAALAELLKIPFLEIEQALAVLKSIGCVE